MGWTLVALGYLCGTFPTGVLLGRSVGVDPRTAGSGNVGATNVLRTAGVRLGLLTLLGDALKGLVPVVLARYAAPDVVGAVAVATVLGHSFPIFAAFRGGKGVATGLGALLALCPVAAALSVIAFVAIVLTFRYVSVASMSAAIIASPIAWWLGAPAMTIAAAAAIAAVIVVRHRENIARLAAGREPRAHLPKRQALHEK